MYSRDYRRLEQMLGRHFRDFTSFYTIMHTHSEISIILRPLQFYSWTYFEILYTVDAINIANSNSTEELHRKRYAAFTP